MSFRYFSLWGIQSDSFCHQILSNFWMSLRHFSPWGIHPDPFVAYWANFVFKFHQIFEWHTGILVLGLLNVIQAFWSLGLSNWSICILLSQFCKKILSSFWMLFRHFSVWGIQSDPFAASLANLVIGFYETSECHSCILVLGAFNLIHLHPLEPILSLDFIKLLNFIQAF